jgi:hypothetical protein
MERGNRCRVSVLIGLVLSSADPNDLAAAFPVPRIIGRSLE